LENVGINPIFDRNIIGLVVQFSVRLKSSLHSIAHTFFLARTETSTSPQMGI